MNISSNEQSLDSKILEAQIIMGARGIRDIALSSPIWAVILAVIFSGILSEIGAPASIAGPTGAVRTTGCLSPRRKQRLFDFI